MKKGEKGLSPVIATTMLILIALILAAIIFVWVRSFIGEKIQKDLGGGPEPIETFCEQTEFVVDLTQSDDDELISVTVQNNGDVPIFGVELLSKGFASVKSIGKGLPDANDPTKSDGVLSGDTVLYKVKIEDKTSYKNKELIVVPVLLGTIGDNGEKKQYTCDREFGMKATVSG